MPPLPKPTETELAILRALWSLGPATVKQVHQHLIEAMGRDRELGYTTVLKMMQTMHDKGLLRRDDSERAHTYRPAEPMGRTQKALVGDFVDRVFAGSAGELVQLALQGRRLDAKEKAALRAMLDGDGK